MSRLVPVARFWDGPEMYAAVAALRSAGLHPVAAEFFHVMMNPMLFVGLGGVRILVVEEEAELAAELIDRCRNGQGADGLEALILEANHEDGLTCPRCASADYFRLKSWIFAAVILVTTGIYAPLTTGRLLCRACGHRWPEAGD